MEIVKKETDCETKDDVKRLLVAEVKVEIKQEFTKHPVKIEFPVLKKSDCNDIKIKKEERNDDCDNEKIQDNSASIAENIGNGETGAQYCMTERESNTSEYAYNNNLEVPKKTQKRKRFGKKIGIENVIKCDLCCKTFATPSTLKTHMQLHRGKYPFVCDICNKPYTRRHLLNAHRYTHTGDRPFVCHICQTGFTRNGSLKKHILSHNCRIHNPSIQSIENFFCDYCGRKFTDKARIKMHILRHMGSKRVECEFCKKKFITKTCLKRHIYTHTGLRPFVCKECNIGFVRKNDYESHVFSHSGQKRFSCDICSKGYARKTELVKHVQSHTTEVMKCKDCDEVFHLEKNFVQHQHLHINMNLIAEQLENGKYFACEICKKKFNAKHSFLKHINYFLTKCSYKCKKCHKKCRNKSDFENHVCCGNKKKNLMCKTCNLSFETPGKLKRHMYMHSIE